MKHIYKYIFSAILFLLLTSTLQSSPKAFDSLGNELEQLKSEKDRLYNVYINSNCMGIGIEIVQKLSDREYGINHDRKFAKLYTSETSFTSRGRASIYVYRKYYRENVTYTTGFKGYANSYRECSRREINKYLEHGEKYSKASTKYNQANRKAREKRELAEEKDQKKAGCEDLSKKTDKGTISGYSGSILDDGFWVDAYEGNYYVETSKATAKSILSNRDRKIIVKRTGRTRRFSLYELYPYQTKNGESEYSKRAMQHARRYPASKFKTLEEVSLVGLWDSLCK